MQTVCDPDGRRLLLLDRSAESSLVRDPETGATERVPTDRLTPCEDEAGLVAAASGVPESIRRVLTAVPDERTLGLLCDLVDREGAAVETMLDAYDFCESDLHGRLAEFRAAGLVRETTVAGHPGYEPTPLAVDAVDRLRE